MKKKNIYGVEELIHGSILLTSERTGKQKWFLVCEIEDNKANRKNFSPDDFGKHNIRLASDFNISQKKASMMQSVSSEGLTPYRGYKF